MYFLVTFDSFAQFQVQSNYKTKFVIFLSPVDAERIEVPEVNLWLAHCKVTSARKSARLIERPVL